jgi:hypothetical protein
MHEFFKDHVLEEAKSYYQYDDTPGVLPHVWLDAKQVWFSLSVHSPTHECPAVSKNLRIAAYTLFNVL